MERQQEMGRQGFSRTLNGGLYAMVPLAELDKVEAAKHLCERLNISQRAKLFLSFQRDGGRTAGRLADRRVDGHGGRPSCLEKAATDLRVLSVAQRDSVFRYFQPGSQEHRAASTIPQSLTSEAARRRPCVIPRYMGSFPVGRRPVQSVSSGLQGSAQRIGTGTPPRPFSSASCGSDRWTYEPPPPRPPSRARRLWPSAYEDMEAEMR